MDSTSNTVKNIKNRKKNKKFKKNATRRKNKGMMGGKENDNIVVGNKIYDKQGMYVGEAQEQQPTQITDIPINKKISPPPSPPPLPPPRVKLQEQSEIPSLDMESVEPEISENVVNPEPVVADANQQPEEIAEQPVIANTNQQPEEIAEQPEGIAEQPEGIAEQPEGIVEQPEGIAEQPVIANTNEQPEVTTEQQQQQSNDVSVTPVEEKPKEDPIKTALLEQLKQIEEQTNQIKSQLMTPENAAAAGGGGLNKLMKKRKKTFYKKYKSKISMKRKNKTVRNK